MNKFDVNEVINKSDLVAYVNLASGGKLEKTNGRYSCPCPIHGGDNETGFSVYYDAGKWKWHCFTRDCGSGDAISFIELWQYSREPDRGMRFKLACEWIVKGTFSDNETLYKSASERAEEAKIEAEAAEQRKQARLRELQETQKHIFYNSNLKEWSINEWIKAGLDVGLQDYFKLGACDDFTYKVKEDLLHTPTLTIPFFDENENVLQIQHRLLNPKNPKDKYRPEKTGIGTPMFYAMPTVGLCGDLILVVEGAKKAMVTWSRFSGQVVGVPIQTGYDLLHEDLRGKNVVIIPDPAGNASEEVLKKPYNLAKAINGKVLQLPAKPDDYLLETQIDENGFYRLLKQARKV